MLWQTCNHPSPSQLDTKIHSKFPNRRDPDGRSVGAMSHRIDFDRTNLVNRPCNGERIKSQVGRYYLYTCLMATRSLQSTVLVLDFSPFTPSLWAVHLLAVVRDIYLFGPPCLVPKHKSQQNKLCAPIWAVNLFTILLFPLVCYVGLPNSYASMYQQEPW